MIEFKVNLLHLVTDEHFVACGLAMKSRRTMMVCNGEVVAECVGGSQ